jgi:ankyrin repeat protein
MRRSTVLLLALVWGRLALAGEIDDAARRGDLAKVKELVKASPKLVFSRDNKGETPLLVAVKAGQRDVAAFLLANKADVNAKGKDRVFRGEGLSGIELGGTPLHWAVLNWDKEMVALLLTNRANVNIRDGDGDTPLHEAAQVGTKEVTELLLAWKADVKAASKDGLTPLHWAAQYGRRDIAEMLLRNGADVNAMDHEGHTPLHLIGQGDGDKAMVDLLLVKGADINAKDDAGDTPLHLAAQSCVGDIALAELLVAKGADVNANDKKGYTPLSIPKYYACPRLTELLQRHGGYDPGPIETDIIRAAKNGDVQAVKALIAKDPSLAFREDENGNTPLGLASLYGLIDVAQVLAVNKAVVNATNRSGVTALNSAASGAMAELLVDKGADVNARDNIGWTPLHCAARVCAKDVAAVLVTHGADVNATNNDAWTPLHWAARDGCKETVEFLLAHKASVNCTNDEGETALSMVKRMPFHNEIEEFLRQHEGAIDQK